jgi:putative transposase
VSVLVGRPLRTAPGDLVYHVLNRANGRQPLFDKDGDYAAFERVLAEACQRVPMRILVYCLMPNHWHLVLWPHRDGDLSRFMGWLTLTHTQRWHAHHHTVGYGHLYQGRFKSFLIQQDAHLLTVCRYVERNALRAGLVARVEQWRWGSAWQDPAGPCTVPLSAWPVERPVEWARWVNEPETEGELTAVRRSVAKGQPFGSSGWVDQMVTMWNLLSTLRVRGRPRKELVRNGS